MNSSTSTCLNMFRFLPVLLFFLLSNTVHSQTVRIENRILDKDTEKPVQRGLIRILSLANQKYVQGSSINIDGKSKVRLSLGSYIFEITSEGYLNHSDTINIQAENDKKLTYTFYLMSQKTGNTSVQNTRANNNRKENNKLYNIQGYIWDKPGGRPLSNTNIRLLNVDTKRHVQGGTTSPDGRFLLHAKNGDYILYVQKEGIGNLEKKISVNDSDSDLKSIYLTENLDKETQKTDKTIPIHTDNIKQANKQSKDIYISGVIHDIHQNSAIENANIRFTEKKNLKSYSFRSKSNGIFRVSLPPNEYELEISAPNYNTVTKTISIKDNQTEYNLETIFLTKSRDIKIPATENIIAPERKDEKIAEEKTVTGIIVDSISKKPVDYAVINFSNDNNTSVATAESIEEGTFTVKIPKGEYYMDIQSFGYNQNKRSISITGNDMDLGIIPLSQNSILLGEAVVLGKTPSIRVKGDTIEYRAEAYLPGENALLQDLIKNIPGVTFDADGNLFANGKRVTKILIDGKEFFGNDIQMALKNLPANMISKLQLFREETELEKIIAFVKGTEDEQVINLELKDEYKQSMFGDVQIGYGNRDRYLERTLLNYMDDKWQVSLLGNLNNINDDAEEPGTFSDDTGTKVSKDAGANINYQKDDKFKIGGNIRYSDNEHTLKNENISEYFLSSGNRYFIENSTSTDLNKKTSFDLSYSWTPKSPFSAFFRISGEHDNHSEQRYSDNLSYVTAGDTTRGWEDYQFSGIDKSIKSSLVLGWKFNEEGRALSLSLNGSLKKENGNGTNKSVTSYALGEEEKDIDQILSKNSDNRNWTATLSYLEPLNENHSLMFSYSLNKGKMNRNNDFYRQDLMGNYTVIDSAYTRATENRETNQIISLGFQGKQKKYEYNAVLNVEPVKSASQIMVGDSLIQEIKQDAINYSATLRFVYKPQKNSTLNVFYTGIINQPGVDQLSTDTVIMSPLYKVYGNSDLKYSLTNNLNIQYQKSDFESGRFFMLTGGLNLTKDKIVEYSHIDDLGNTETTYRNVNGNWGANLGAIFNSPLKNSDFTFDSNTTMSYTRNLGFMNSDKSITNNYSISENLSLSFDSDIFESRLQAYYTYINSRNNLSESQNTDLTTFGIGNTFSLDLPLNFNLQNDITYTRNIGYAEGFKKSEILWSASLTKYFLKKEKGALKLQIYDILKDRNNVTRAVNNNFITDIRTNAVSRYFLLSFTYRFHYSPNSESK